MTLRRAVPYWAKKTGAAPYSPPSLTFSSFGSLGAVATKYSGGALAANGNIYMTPATASQVLKLDPTTDTISLFGSLGGTSSKWSGGSLAPNGSIYCAPWGATSVLKIDPTTDTASTFGSLGGGFKWISTILADNGMIYCIPWGATSVLKIDPTTDTTSTFGSFSTTTKWGTAILATNGKIYCAPFNETAILEIDPATDTVRTFGSLAGSAKYFGAVLGDDGQAYFASILAGGGFGVLNPLTDAFSTTGTAYTGQAWGALCDKDGNVYSVPTAVDRIMEIYNPDNLFSDFYSISASDLDSSSDWLRGAVFAQNGVAYGVPASNTKVLKIEGMASFTASDYTLPSPISGLSTSNYNRFFNKF